MTESNTPAVLSILEARDVGALPASLSLNVYRTNVSAHMPRFGPVDFDASARGLAWFREAFPDGEVRPGYCEYRGGKHQPPADRAEYRVDTPAGLIQFHHYAPHVHGSFRGEVRNGKPAWICGGCRKRMTVTDARALGLLPPKSPAKRKPHPAKLSVEAWATENSDAVVWGTHDAATAREAYGALGMDEEPDWGDAKLKWAAPHLIEQEQWADEDYGDTPKDGWVPFMVYGL